MEIGPLPKVECALLHSVHEPRPREELLAILHELIETAGYPGELTPIIAGDDSIHVVVGDHYVLVSQNSKPLSPEGFEADLALPITQMQTPVAASAVRAHVSNTFITIGKGNPMMAGAAEEHSGLFSELGIAQPSFETWAETESALTLCKDVAASIAERRETTLVHWCTCGNLIDGEMFLKLAGGDEPLPIYVQPHLHSSTGRFGDGLPLGITLRGTQFLIGRPIIFAEADLPLHWILERAYQFIAMAHATGAVLPDGHTFGTTEAERIHVTHQDASDELPWGSFTLELKHSEEYRVVGTDAHRAAIQYDDDFQPELSKLVNPETALGAGTDDEYQVALNPEDPIDRAILQRLKTMGAEGEGGLDAEIDRMEGDMLSSLKSTAKRRSGFGRRKQLQTVH